MKTRIRIKSKQKKKKNMQRLSMFLQVFNTTNLNTKYNIDNDKDIGKQKPLISA